MALDSPPPPHSPQGDQAIKPCVPCCKLGQRLKAFWVSGKSLAAIWRCNVGCAAPFLVCFAHSLGTYKGRAYLRVQNTQLCKGLHHLLVIDVASVVTIVPPAKHGMEVECPSRVTTFSKTCCPWELAHLCDDKTYICSVLYKRRSATALLQNAKRSRRKAYLKISAAFAPPPPPPKSMFSQSVFFMVLLAPAVCTSSGALALNYLLIESKMHFPVLNSMAGPVVEGRQQRQEASRGNDSRGGCMKRGLHLCGQGLAWKVSSLCIHQQEVQASSGLPDYPCSLQDVLHLQSVICVEDRDCHTVTHTTSSYDKTKGSILPRRQKPCPIGYAACGLPCLKVQQHAAKQRATHALRAS